MVDDTTLLLDLDGVSVMRVERLQCGGRRVHLATADASARACPACGVFASRVKGWAATRRRDLLYGEGGLESVWNKRRWWCRETACPRRSFTERIEQMPAGARITGLLRAASGRRVRDAGSTVIQAARDLHLSWSTVMNAFRAAPVTRCRSRKASALASSDAGRVDPPACPRGTKYLSTLDRRSLRVGSDVGVPHPLRRSVTAGHHRYACRVVVTGGKPPYPAGVRVDPTGTP